MHVEDSFDVFDMITLSVLYKDNRLIDDLIILVFTPID